MTPGHRSSRGAILVTEARSLSAPPPTAETPLRLVAETHKTAAFIQPHAHDAETQILVPLSGTFHIETDAALWIVPPGKAIVIPAGTIHAVTAPEAATLCALRLDASIWPSSLGSPRSVAMTPLAIALVEAACNIHMPAAENSPDSRLIAVLLDQLQAAPADGFHMRRPADPRLRKIIDVLIHNPGNSLSLAEWGREVGASERTLSRLFEVEIGMGFRDCRRSIQMHSAVARLGENQRLIDVAADLGYESLSAFIHAFRAVIGETPGQVARRMTSKSVTKLPIKAS